MALIRYAATVGGLTMVSRVFGFVRDILIAALVGPGMIGDAFFVAFKLPNFFRRLFAEGAFNAGFVPIFSEVLEREGRDRARTFAEEALSVLLLTLFLFVSLLQIAMPWAMYVFAPGFADQPDKFDLTIQLTRLTFPYLLFISLVSLMGGVLNALHRFAAVAATPILLNLCLIGAILVLAPVTPTPGHALAWGVSLAGIVQFLWLVRALGRQGIALRLLRPRLTPRVRELLVRMAPAVVGAGVVQINLVVDIILASLLPEGSVSFLFFADRVNQLPIGVVGVAVGTALLPMLSRQLAAGREADAFATQNRALELGLILALPAALALLVIAEPAVVVLFERGAFDAADSRATALVLMAYAVGLPAYVLVKVLTPPFFARKDTRTPVRIAMVALAANVVLNLLFIWLIGHAAGLALATALSAWLNTALLAATLRRREFLRLDDRLRRRLPRMVLAAVIMAGALWLGAGALAAPLDGTELARIPALAVLIVGGMLAYAVAALVLGAVSLADLKALLRRPPS
jgi:putative peptidoglycan lipid II flippase